MITIKSTKTEITYRVLFATSGGTDLRTSLPGTNEEDVVSVFQSYNPDVEIIAVVKFEV